ncbi:MAG: gamma carbonic anhydrase family protein, partial [bacterium]
FIAPTATLIGDVVVEENASVWYGAVLRADFNQVIVRAGANVQDNSVLHTTPAAPVEVGPRVTVGHVCVVHSATLEEECLIANGATVLDGAKIGARAMVGAGAVITPNTEVPPGMLAVGVPAKVTRTLAGTPAEYWVRFNPEGYQVLARRHKVGIAPAS